MANISWPDVLTLGVTLVLFVALHVLRRAGIGFATRTFVALVAGAGVGLLMRDAVDYVAPIGTVYVQVITALVAPLIIVSILSSVTSLGSVATLRTIGTSSVFWLLLTNAIAIVLTLGVALALGIGKGVELELDGVDGALLTDLLVPLDEVIIGFFPSNVVGDINSNSIIPIILFALLIAVSYVLVASKDAASVRPFKDLVDATRRILFRAVGFIISATPYAVLALVTVTVSKAAGRVETVLALAGLLVLTMVLSFVNAYVVNGALLRVWGRVNPIPFFQKLTPAQFTAFTTQSSVGTLPLTVSALTRKVGVSGEVANFTAPVGTTIGMPGCAGIWPIIVAVFSINLLGIDYGVGDYVALVVLCLLVSLGTAGVPGTAIITATAVLTAVGLPVEILVILVPISAVAGTASTMANVSAAATAATIVARRQGHLDDDVFRGLKSPDDPTPAAVPEPAAPAEEQPLDDGAPQSAAPGAPAPRRAELRRRLGAGAATAVLPPLTDRDGAGSGSPVPLGQCSVD